MTLQEKRKLAAQQAIKYSYIIRVNDEVYFTTATAQLPLVLTKIKSRLTKLVKSGLISQDEFGTRISQAEQYIADIKERNVQIKHDRIAAGVAKSKATGRTADETRQLRNEYRRKQRERKKALLRGD